MKYIIGIPQADGTKRYVYRMNEHEIETTNRYYEAWDFKTLENTKNVLSYIADREKGYEIYEVNIDIKETKK